MKDLGFGSGFEMGVKSEERPAWRRIRSGSSASEALPALRRMITVRKVPCMCKRMYLSWFPLSDPGTKTSFPSHCSLLF